MGIREQARDVGAAAATGSNARPLHATPIFQASLWLAAAGIAALLWTLVCTVPGIHWNAARLAPSFALAYGHTVYALRDSAAQLGWIYGPVFPLWYLPATLTENPTVALAIAGIQNAVTWMAPWVLLLRATGLHGGSLWAGLALGAAGFLGSPFWGSQLLYVHVDAVCVALGLVAAAALYHASHGGRTRALHVAALAVALAIWTKQIAVALPLGMMLWLWGESRRDLIWPLVFWSACYLALTTALFFVWFGGEPLMFNLVLFHLKNPALPAPAVVAEAVRAVGAGILPLLPAAICGVALWRRHASGAPRSGSSAAPLVRLLLWVALAHLPLGVASLFKTGGGVNSLHTLHYGFAAGLVVLVHLLARPVSLDRRRPWLAAACAAALLIPVGTGLLFATRTQARWQMYRGLDHMVAMARAKPDTYYFPWNPLVTLIAERRVYPFDDALLSLWRCGLEVPPATLRAGLPPRPVIIYDEPVQSKFALRYFPELRTAP